MKKVFIGSSLKHQAGGGDGRHVGVPGGADDFNIQVDEEMATYVDDEMIERGDAEDAEMCGVTDVIDVCESKQESRKKKCPGQKRRIVTVTQWDASARKQMIQQLGQRGVT